MGHIRILTFGKKIYTEGKAAIRQDLNRVAMALEPDI
jgi:hypothetical protein